MDRVTERIWNAKHRALNRLDLRNCNLTSLPPAIAELTRLQILNLSTNQLREIPPEIAQLTRLRVLFLDHNKISRVPPWIAELPQLKRLEIVDNRLAGLPPEMARLTQLRTLHLNTNQLTELPPPIARLTQLEALGLANNQIAELSPQIGRLTQLRTLDLRKNQLRELPQNIAELTHLRMLDLRNNKLTIVPRSIGQLTQLITLYLSYNQLRELPPEIGQLKRLRKLHVSFNQIKSLPPEIIQLPLEDLNAQQNPLETRPSPLRRSIEFPARYLEAGTAILSYFATILRQKYADTEAKVTIERAGLRITMKIESPDGEELEQIEKTFDEYGAVVQGLLPVEEFLPDPLQAMELRQQLRIAQVQLENKNELLAARGEMIAKLEGQISELYTLVGRVAQREPVQVNVISGQAGSVGQNPQTSASTFVQDSRAPDRKKAGDRGA